MDVKSRREEYAGMTREAIVQAATVGNSQPTDSPGRPSTRWRTTARVTKGAVYHHFKDKAELFEAVFVVMEERLVARVAAAVAGIDDPWEIMADGVDAYLDECCEADFRRIALQEAPAALGWARWKEIEEQYFLGLVKATLDALARYGLISVPPSDLTARMLLAAASEAGLAVAASPEPGRERDRVRSLFMRFVGALR